MKHVYLPLLLICSTLMTAGPNCSTLNSSQKSKSIVPSTHKNDTPSYAGVVTHIMSESVIDGQKVIFPCMKDVIVYTYDDEYPERCKYVTRLSETYYNKFDSSVQTSPDISDLKLNVLNASFSKFSDAMYVHVDIENNLGHGTYRLGIDSAVFMPITPIANHTTVVCSTAFSNDKSYLPGLTHKLCEALNKKIEDLKIPVSQIPRGFESPKVALAEITEPSNVTDLLKIPGPHPLSIVVAFLKIEKKNNVYQLVPTENSRICS